MSGARRFYYNYNGRGKKCRPVFFLFAFFFLAALCFSQEGNSQDGSAGAFPPDSVRRPVQGEAPRYPRDMIIGELGRGSAPEEAWIYAGDFISALLADSKEAPVLAGTDETMLARVLEDLQSVEPRNVHIGGGRLEADGSVSFLVRFLGRELSITGELYLLPKGEDGGPVSRPWRVDDLVLEESRSLAEERETYRYDFTPYERFY